MTVKHRHIYYVSGFDPRGASFYYRLYRKESLKQADAGGLKLLVEERERHSDISSRWQVRSEVDGQTVNTTYEFLQWDDIIRAHWVRNELAILVNYLKCFWIYSTRGVLNRVLKVSWPPFVTALGPLIGLAGMVALAISLVVMTANLMPTVAASAAAGLSAAALLAAGMLMLIRLLEKKFKLMWLLRIYYFSAQQGMGELTDLEARLDQFARHIVDQTDPSEDEVLIVGHSTGSIMAISLMSRVLALRADFSCDEPGRLSLLTLGQCIPMVCMLPEARRYREDLVRINQSEHVEWIDFTAPTDGACFALTDPLAISGLQQKNPADPKPKLLSPRFARLFAPQSYARIRRNWYRNHFQYIMASERSGEYDYFAITAGNLTLKERHLCQPSVQNYRRPLPFL